jgi:hypothetical protein
MIDTLILASIISADSSMVLAAIQRTRYECSSIVSSEYLGPQSSSRYFMITCVDNHQYKVSIGLDNTFRVWKK